jgi:hypothetical protein
MVTCGKRGRTILSKLVLLREHLVPKISPLEGVHLVPKISPLEEQLVPKN